MHLHYLGGGSLAKEYSLYALNFERPLISDGGAVFQIANQTVSHIRTVTSLSKQKQFADDYEKHVNQGPG